MDRTLAGRVALVTGGGSGIGEAIVRHFAEQGARVGFIDIAEAASRQLEAELTAAGHAVRFKRADVADIKALRAAIAANWGRSPSSSTTPSMTSAKSSR